jgi:homoserine dehydrogenase
MFEDKLDYSEALLLAQQLGFAESNPALDVEGYDALNKWTFLLTHAYGIVTESENIVFTVFKIYKALMRQLRKKKV